MTKTAGSGDSFYRPSVIDHFIKQAMNQIYKITAIAVMAAFLVQCSPKATAPLVESPNVTETPPPTRNHPIPVRVLAICRAMTATKQRPPLFCTKTK